MKKSDCVTIFACIVFLFFALGAIGHAGREQARILTCAASLKQIAKLITLYQNDNDGYVPVMRSKWALFISAQTSLLSLPFRHYSGAAELPAYFNPVLPWTWADVAEYSQNFLPKFFVCPFAREKKGEVWEAAETVYIAGASWLARTNYVSRGRGDSYSTWIWNQPRTSWQRGSYFIPNHPYGPDHGKSKYDNVVWHTCGDCDLTGCWPNGVSCPHGVIDKVHRVRFTTLRRMSERTAVYCAHGEIDMSAWGMVNMYGSHARSGKGGTNALFGDGHVEWIQGSQITTW